jgi:ssDNA-binding Zn-finger/Zn-ribbon topoisomerase 1
LTERKKLRCPECGAEMNFHAEKVDLSRTFEDVALADRAFGGVLVEIHTCPVCKFVLEQPSG